MVNVDMRKLVFYFVMRMSDVGVGVEADYYEKVRNFFHSFFGRQYRISTIIGKMVSEMLQMLTELRRCYGSRRLSDDGNGD